jgi:hypothetical protein
MYSHCKKLENKDECPVILCYIVSLKMTNVSEVLTASIIRELTHHPVDGGNKYL